jgi:hypothetical protein
VDDFLGGQLTGYVADDYLGTTAALVILVAVNLLGGRIVQDGYVVSPDGLY